MKNDVLRIYVFIVVCGQMADVYKPAHVVAHMWRSVLFLPLCIPNQGGEWRVTVEDTFYLLECLAKSMWQASSSSKSEGIHVRWP